MTTIKPTFKMKSINGDSLTPITIYKQLSGNNKFLLESSFQHETKGKYSYIGVNPIEEIIGNNAETTIINHLTNQTNIFNIDALTYIKRHLPKIDTPLPLPFSGGAIGYVGYDAYRQYADIGEMLESDIGMPDIHFMIYREIIVYEHFSEKVYIIAMNLDDAPGITLDKRILILEEQLKKPILLAELENIDINFTPQLTKDAFIKQVEQAKAYINSGETTQIVLSQKFNAPMTSDPLSFYRYLRSSNPSPYMFYIDFTDYLIIGASPESLVQTTGDKVITNPIAGTRPRGKNDEEDTILSKDLLSDPKEVNEHDMLVELSKADLSPICYTETIKVPVYKKIEKYEHVMHIVSEVHGQLLKNTSSIDALIACLPAGTVSGAPKTRAMQIINEIENKKREFYAGGIGYITFNHDVNLAISIRSIVIKDEVAYLQTGAGIVIDSIPEKEYEETLHKARSLMELNKNN